MEIQQITSLNNKRMMGHAFLLTVTCFLVSVLYSLTLKRSISFQRAQPM
jgi:hypothetical protein